MNIIETKPIGSALFHNFSVDYHGDTFVFAGKEYKTGQITNEILRLSPTVIMPLFYAGNDLNNLYNALCEHYYSESIYTAIRDKLKEILEHIKNEKPFCYFNIAEEKTLIEEVLGDEALKGYSISFGSLDEPLLSCVPQDSNLQKYMTVLCAIVEAYIFLCADTYNFFSVACMYFANLTDTGCRDKTFLASFTEQYFGNEEMVKFIEENNPVEITHAFTLEPQVRMAPVIRRDEKGLPMLGRRTHFNRMLNFYVTDMFEGLAVGHYSWQCGICHKFFFMTTAHQQLYCSSVNPDYGVPCSHVAKNKLNMPKQKKEDGRGYDTWKHRDDSIRSKLSQARNNKPNARYDVDTCLKAKELINRYFEQAQIDFDYAENGYEQDMILENVFAEAKRLLGKK